MSTFIFENNVQSGWIWTDTHKKYSFRDLFVNFMACLWNQTYKIVAPSSFTPFYTLYISCETVQNLRNNNVELPFWKQLQVLSAECHILMKNPNLLK